MKDDQLIVKVAAEDVAIGVMIAYGCRVAVSSPALLSEIERGIAKALECCSSEEAGKVKAAVRDMLRHGSYRPTGRGKPASEYLLNAAAASQFPRINNVVDIANLASLEYLLPVSIIDVARAQTTAYCVRWGREGENYIFNQSGQVLELRDLLLLAGLPSDFPCASPVKDSHATKVNEDTTWALGIVYAPKRYAERAKAAAERMAFLMNTYCGASSVVTLI